MCESVENTMDHHHMSVFFSGVEDTLKAYFC